MARYEKVGSVYRKKENPWPAVIFIGLVAFAIIGAFAG